MYDIVAQIAADLGGADKLTETRIGLIRRFASLCVLLEEQEVLIAGGSEVNVMRYCKMSSTLMRLSSRIGLKRFDPSSWYSPEEQQEQDDEEYQDQDDVLDLQPEPEPAPAQTVGGVDK
jgi:hypothetical protein